VSTRSKDEAVLAATPLGKIPFIRTDDGTLCESQVIVDYLEARFPQPALVPADPFGAAKVRELCHFMELYVEWVARELYAQAFFGGTVSDDTRERVRRQLARNVPGFLRLAKFSPYVAGEQFTLADCSAWVSLPLVAMSTRLVLGEDMLAAAGIDWKGYARLIAERPAAQKVAADRKADEAAMAAARGARSA
jgi:glutathione S-transferase